LVVALGITVFRGLLSTPTRDSQALKAIHETNRELRRHLTKAWVLPANLQGIAERRNPVDPWRRDLLYTMIDTEHYELRSLGADGVRSEDDVIRVFDASDIVTASPRTPE